MNTITEMGAYKEGPAFLCTALKRCRSALAFSIPKLLVRITDIQGAETRKVYQFAPVHSVRNVCCSLRFFSYYASARCLVVSPLVTNSLPTVTWNMRSLYLPSGLRVHVPFDVLARSYLQCERSADSVLQQSCFTYRIIEIAPDNNRTCFILQYTNFFGGSRFGLLEVEISMVAQDGAAKRPGASISSISIPNEAEEHHDNPISSNFLPFIFAFTMIGLLLCPLP